MNWHKITEKLAPINEYVFILSVKQNHIRIAKLNIYDKNNNEINSVDIFTNGDIYWLLLNEENINENRHNWGRITLFPYWLTKEELILLTLKKQKQLDNDEESDRFELLDL